MPPSLRAEYLHKLCRILHGSIFLFLPLYCFSHAFISVWTHGYLFYILAYKLILLCLFCCSNFSNFSHSNSFTLALVCPWPTFIQCSFFFLSFFLPTSLLSLHILLSDTTIWPRFILYVILPNPGIIHLFKELQLISLKNGMRNQDQSALCPSFYWGVITSGIFNWQRKAIYVCV